VSETVLTPMQRQYFEIKEKNRNSLLFFRLGDFYELFYEDAKIASEELGLTLTARHKKTDHPMIMCGIPYHAADKYLARLTKKGYRIAICDQVSDPNLPGIVKREVVQIVTPGTTFQEEVLDEKNNNFLISIFEKNNIFALSYLDITTGELQTTKLIGFNAMQEELFRIKPVEVIMPHKMFSESEVKNFLETEFAIKIYNFTHAGDEYEYLLEYFAIQNLKSFDLEDESLLITSTANLLAYIQETQKTKVNHIQSIKRYYSADFMHLDRQTIRNLELITTLYDNNREGSLLSVLDHTLTSSGARLFRKVLLSPLIKKNEINERLDAVEYFYQNSEIRSNFKIMKNIYDIERIISRLSCNRGNAKDLIALKDSLNIIPEIAVLIKGDSNILLSKLKKIITNPILNELIILITASINDDAPFLLSEGKIIKSGHNSELDELRKILQGSTEWLEKYQIEQRQKTGITTLKVNFNKVFGYYIEISKGQSSKAPEEYTRKQTLTNAERYITPILKQYEEKVLTAKDKIFALEFKLFHEIREKVVLHVKTLQNTAKSLAWLDLFHNFATIAHKNNFVKPIIEKEGDMIVTQSRHPVIEKILDVDDNFVPNDILFDKQQQAILLTGPNMAGKSTFLRQTALIVLLAQIGSYVPAKKAILPVIDRIFTRVGASDNLTKGQSTFMVEMQETASILNNATTHSLLILDEVGRGTSTYDGLSLAWAIFEYIHSKIKAKTLFATHYHEMIKLAENLDHAQNYSMAVTEDSEGVVFLRKVVPGGVDQSYGIEVAKLAGLPESVLEKANLVLTKLENNDSKSNPNINKLKADKKSNTDQLTFFAPQIVEKIIVKNSNHKVLTELDDLDLNSVTPIQALMKLHEWQKNK